jgi:hypothetical protein
MTVNTVSEVQTTLKEPERERGIFAFKATRVVWLFLSIFEALLAVRFVMKFIGGKPASPLAAVIYGVTGFLRLRMFQF